MTRLGIAIGAVVLAAFLSPSAALAVSVGEVITMHQSGTSESALLKKVRSEGVDASLSAEDLNTLLKAGVGAAVIDAMLAVEPAYDPAHREAAGPTRIAQTDVTEDDMDADDGGGGWSSGELISWTDEHGNIHYTNDPSTVPSQYRNGGKKKPPAQPSPPAPSGNGDVVRAPQAATRTPYVMSSRIVQIVDSNTLRLATGEDLRLIGCSELRGMESRGAISYLRSTIANKPVNIIFDVRKRDPVKRGEGPLAGYVFFEQMTFVNAELIRQGLVRNDPDGVNLEYVNLFERLESTAKTNNRGLWR